jgi:hypothetical protein
MVSTNRSQIMRSLIITFTSATALTLGALAASANEFTRLDALAAVNRDGKNGMIDTDNNHLAIEFLRMPGAPGDMGKVCGSIVSLRRSPSPHAMNSYAATLWIESGRLLVGSMSSFFMPVSELVETDTCR